MNTFGAQDVHRCCHCHASGADVAGLILKKCKGCHAVKFCSHECQRKEWKRHKRQCQKVGLESRAVSSTGVRHQNENENESGTAMHGEQVRNNNPLLALALHSHPIMSRLGYASKHTMDNFMAEVASCGLWTAAGWTLAQENKAREILEEAYETRLLQPWLSILPFVESKQAGVTAGEAGDSKIFGADLAKRLHATSEEDRQAVLQWYFHKRSVGDIFRDRRIKSYAEEVRQSFTNAPLVPQPITLGHAHVAVGFVDMSGLAYLAIVVDGNTELLDLHALERIPVGSVKLTFLGVDSSPFQVAKTLALWGMIQRICSKESIAQVWYSSVWDRETAAEFQTTCAMLIAKPFSDSDVSLTTGVTAYLAFWASSGVKILDLEAARQEWLNSVHASDGLNNLGHFKRKIDREELGIYALTGEFATVSESSANKCGSLTIYNVPEGSPKLYANEHLLHALSFEHLQSQLEKSPEQSYLSAASAVIFDGITRLQILEARQLVDVRLIHATLGPISPQHLIDSIAGLHAYTMSWSNVPDYLHPRDLHRLARRLTPQGDCLHFGYSMNWVKNVYGTNLLDLKFAGASTEALVGVIEAGLNTVRLANHPDVTKFPHLFRDVPPTNIHNLAGWTLQVGQYRKWLSGFLFHPDHTHGPVSVPEAASHMSPYYSQARTSTCCFLWTYDQNLNLHVQLDRDREETDAGDHKKQCEQRIQEAAHSLGIRIGDSGAGFLAD